MRPQRRTAAILFLATFAPAARAGGVGVLLDGGMHTESVYFYSDTVYSADNEEGVPVDDPDEWSQFKMTQTLPHFGGGLELVLGDRDDRILGIFRLYYTADTAQKDPATLSESELTKLAENDPDAEVLTEAGQEVIVKPDAVHATVRDQLYSTGLASVGLSWGIIGNPDRFQLGATGHVGSGFLTLDHREYLFWTLGPTVTYKAARQVQLFADANYQMRLRKGLSHGGNVIVGARYLFD